MVLRRYDTLTDPSGRKFSGDAAKKGGSAAETDHDMRCRAFPQEDFNEMAREAQTNAEADKRLPPGVKHAPNTVAGLFVGGSGDSRPSFDAVISAYNGNLRPFDAAPLSPEELAERESRRMEIAQRDRNNLLVAAVFAIVVVVIVAAIVGYLLYLHPSAR